MGEAPARHTGRGAATATSERQVRRARRGTVRRRRRLRQVWRLGTLGLLAAALLVGAVARGDGRADVSLRASQTAFERLQVSGAAVQVVAAEASAAGWRTTLAARSATLAPVHPVPPGRTVHVSVVVRDISWLGRLPWNRQRIAAVRWAPPDPSLRATGTTTLAGQPLYVHLSAPGAALRASEADGGALSAAPLADDPDVWKVDVDTAAAPAGAIDISTQATPWEAFSAPQALHWSTVPMGSLLRLQQMLAQLDYLPLRWSPAAPAASGRCRCRLDLTDPPPGSFRWRWPAVPSGLARLWAPGEDNEITQGAVIAFDRVHGLPILPYATPAMWQALVEAWEGRAADPHAYTYVQVSENQPETLRLWRDGRVVLTSLVNTARPPAHTHVGTFPIHLRFQSQAMRGTGPNGQPYYYPDVQWVNYFQGNDAIHAFPRQAYGFPQSAGCVEMPPAQARTLFGLVHYGTLVTVSPPTVA